MTEPRSPETGAEFSLLTINLLSGGTQWDKRRNLMVDQIYNLSPDVLAVQEVTRAEDAQELADRLGYPYTQLCWKTEGRSDPEAIALISRLPLEQPACLNLYGQQRTAQRAVVSVSGQPVVLVNAHLYWQPGDSNERLRQIKQILEWLEVMPGQPPAVIAGDFNGTPETRALKHIARDYDSAYAAIHGREPEHTYPTPLKRSKLEMLFSVLDLWIYIRPKVFKLSLKNTLDYIFVDRRLQVIDCYRTLDQPAPDDPNLYPSDHYGLLAKIAAKDS